MVKKRPRCVVNLEKFKEVALSVAALKYEVDRLDKIVHGIIKLVNGDSCGRSR